MRTIKKPKCAAILERDPGLFSEKVNALIDQLAEAGAEIDKPQPYRTADGFFCAVVNYTEILKVYDNVKEEYENRGEVYFCVDGPLYRPQPDGRRKGGYCARKSFVADGATACKRFYEDLATGEIEPVRR